MSVVQSPVNETNRYSGPERRTFLRIPAGYPVCVRFISPDGGKCERYAQTRNVSAEGVLFSCTETLAPGTKVDMLMGIPSAYAASLPAAHFNLALLYEEHGLPREAARQWGRFIALAPDGPDAAFARQRLRAAQKR